MFRIVRIGLALFRWSGSVLGCHPSTDIAASRLRVKVSSLCSVCAASIPSSRSASIGGRRAVRRSRPTVALVWLRAALTPGRALSVASTTVVSSYGGRSRMRTFTSGPRIAALRPAPQSDATSLSTSRYAHLAALTGKRQTRVSQQAAANPGRSMRTEADIPLFYPRGIFRETGPHLRNVSDPSRIRRVFGVKYHCGPPGRSPGSRLMPLNGRRKA